jgi:tRNA threonylcarbamoyladenosine biosynthesis protein TsaE
MNDEQGTIALGHDFGKRLVPGSIVALFGELGSGKTTFTKGIAKSLGIDADAVSSPTFTYLNIYDGTPPLYHFDLYRLASADHFFALGFDEYFQSGGICVIEWAERIRDSLPSHALSVRLEHASPSERMISFV